MRYVIIAEIRNGSRRERWRGIYDGKETLNQIAERACGSEWRWFTLVATFTENEYTPQKGREAWERHMKLPFMRR